MKGKGPQPVDNQVNDQRQALADHLLAKSGVLQVLDEHPPFICGIRHGITSDDSIILPVREII